MQKGIAKKKNKYVNNEKKKRKILSRKKNMANR